MGDDGDGGLWEATVARHHPPGRARPPGGQVRHWIRPERHGVPGAVGFGSATWSPAARDRWIGRSADTRPGVRAAEVTVTPPGRATDAEPLSVPAVPSSGTGPPEDGGELPHRPLPTTERPAEGEADAVFAATVLDRYRRRWMMETRFRTPGRGRGSGPVGPAPPGT